MFVDGNVRGKMEVVILAGGKGTRMGEQTEKIPKPMISVGSSPILIHIMDYYVSWGARKFVICCGYKLEYIRKFFRDISELCEKVDDYTIKTTYKNTSVYLVDTGIETGTAGRIFRIRKYLSGDMFYLTYGDGVSDINLVELKKEHVSSKRMVTISAVHPKERFGIVQFDDGNKVISFQEKIKRSEVWINGGFMLLDTTVFNYFNDSDNSFEYDILPQLVDKELVGVYRHSGFWQCMDTENERKDLEKILEAREISWT